MQVPKRKTSKSKRDMRRSHHGLEAVTSIGKCPNCGEPVLSHRVCKACGFYRGRKLLDVATRE